MPVDGRRQPEIRFASTLSCAPDTDAAARAAGDELAEELGGRADLVIAFVSAEHAGAIDRVRARIAEPLEAQVVLACTTQGAIGVRREVEQGPVMSVLAGRLPGVALCPLSYEHLDWPDVLEAPATLRAALGDHAEHCRAVLMLADPFSTPMVRVLPAFGAALPGVPVVGGMASAGRKPRENRLLLGDTVLTEGAVGVAVAGPVDVQTTVSQGCRPIGRPMVITRAKRHVVQELGGRPALRAVQEMVQGLDAADQALVQATGLRVGRVVNEYKQRFGRGDFLIRELVGVDPDAGYLAIGDPQVRAGQTIQFHVRDQRAAAEDFAMMLGAQKVYGPPAGAMLFSCNGRGSRLFDEPDTDARLVHDALGDVPLAGFFAAGELGPIGDASFVHGHTVSLLTFRPVQTDPRDAAANAAQAAG